MSVTSPDGLATALDELLRNLTNATQVLDRTPLVTESIGQYFLFSCSVLVLAMQVGFTLLEAGKIRENLLNIIAKNISDLCLCSLAWYTFGYSIAFGDHAPNAFSGWAPLFWTSDNRAHWLFTFTYAATSATIVSGAMAERTKFKVYVLFTLLESMLIYPPLCHWLWSKNGFMSMFNQGAPLPVIDFAGCSVVHMCGGVCAFVGAWLVGPRAGVFKESDDPIHFASASQSERMVVERLLVTQQLWMTTGTFILFFGWFGFNCGSIQNVAKNPKVFYRVMVCTILSPVGGSLMAAFLAIHKRGVLPVEDVLMGIISGLVSITAACATISPMFSFIIGCIGAVIHQAVSRCLVIFEVDDPVDAVSIHFGCGVWGILAAGLFMDRDKVDEVYGFSMGHSTQIGYQALCSIVVTAWCLILAFIAFSFLSRMFNGLGDSNVEAKHQTLSLVSHNRSAGLTTIVVVDMEAVSAIEAMGAELLAVTVDDYLHVIRQEINANKGYEFFHEKDFVTISFNDAMDAVRFCIGVQLLLLQVRWTLETYFVKECGLEEDAQGVVIFKGPRARMAINMGYAQVEHTKKGKSVYSGDVVIKTNDLHQCSTGGQIMCAENVIKALVIAGLITRSNQEILDSVDSFVEGESYIIDSVKATLTFLGDFQLQGSATRQQEKLFQLVPTKVKSREFANPLLRVGRGTWRKVSPDLEEDEENNFTLSPPLLPTPLPILPMP